MYKRQTVFSFELLGYCPVGNFAGQSVWDLDEISVTAICAPNTGCTAAGGTITGGPFTFNSVGDGTPDMIPAGSISLSGNQGANTQWIVTDDQGYILGLPPMPSVVNFDNPGAGTCLIWHLTYDGTVVGLEVGQNAGNLQGCFGLSNSIEVIRNNASGCNANGGELFGGPFTFNSVGDGTPDNIPAGSITRANTCLLYTSPSPRD